MRSRIAKVPDQLYSEIDGKMVVLGIESGKYYEFDEIGSDIWSRIDTYPLVADLCDALVRDYAADLQTVRADVSSLMAILEGNDLITVSHD